MSMDDKQATIWDNYAALKLFEKLMVKNYCIQSHSFEEYVNKKSKSKARLIKMIMWILLSLMMAFRYFILTFYHDEWFLAIQGEYLHKMYKLEIAGPAVCLLNVTVAQIRVFFWYFESRSKFQSLDLFYNLYTNSREYRLLDNKYEKRFSKILFIVFRLIFGGNINPFVVVFLILNSFIAYLTYLDGKSYLIIAIINALIFSIYGYQIITTAYITGYSIFVTTLYLKYKFGEIIDNMLKGIQQKDELLLYYSMVKHNLLTDFTHQLNDYISFVIGIVFSNCTGLFLLYFYAAMDQGVSLIMRIFLLFCVFLFISFIFTVNLMTASISTANKSVVKHLYPIFIDKKLKNIWTKLKVDSFIERLNRDFIGFYCYNLFKMTKRAFYEYFSILTSGYFLIYGFIKDNQI